MILRLEKAAKCSRLQVSLYRLETQQQFHMTAQWTDLFLKNSVCRDSFMYLFTLSLIRKQYSVKFYCWMTTVYENKVIKKRPWLGSLGLKSNRLSQAGPIQTREGKTANFRWLFCLWIEKLCPLSLATSYSISEDSVLAFLIHLPALMFAFWRKRNFTFLVLVLLKSCHVGGH